VQVKAGVAPNRALAAGSWLVLETPDCSNQLRSVVGALATAPGPEGGLIGSVAAAAARESRQSKQSVRSVIRLDIEVSF
jgi:hypothetical protein